MTPLFFGTSQRRLFGLYLPPRRRVPAPKSIVLCHPWGQEYLRAHRSMRQLGNLLAAAGHHVFRFDYFGTGDSAGDMVDADLAGWERDIEMAMQELMDTSGATRVSLAGLRLGSTLAARVAARHKREVDMLAMWDPLVSGPEHLAELIHDERKHARKAGAFLPRPEAEGGGHEVRGFPLTSQMENDIRGLDLVQLVPSLPARSVVVTSTPLESHAALRAALAQRPDGEAAFERIDSLCAWQNHQNLGAGAIPARLLERLVSLLS
jgi:pimeloyl-ACP methyl ester carboxylesterase